MAQERASVFEAPFIGVESLADPGTAVAATKQLESIGFAMKPKIETSRFAPKGSKVDTILVPGKDFTEWAIDGRADYNNIVYPLASVLSSPAITTPGGATNVRDWDFGSQSDAPDLQQTYTIDVGSHIRAARARHVVINEFGLTFTRDSVTLSGSAIGKQMEDPVYLNGLTVYTLGFTGTVTGGTFTVTVGAATTAAIAYNATAATVQLEIGKLSTVSHGNVYVTGGPGPASYTVVFTGALFGTSVTMTASGASLTGTTPGISATSVQAGAAVSTIAALPAAPGSVSVYADDTSGALGTTKLLRCLQAELRIGGRNAPLWVLDAAQTSWANVYETANDVTLKLKMVADGVGMGYLSTIRNGATKFVRIEATGAAFASPDGSFNRRLRVDVAGKVEMPDDFGGDTVTTVDWTLRLVEDATWDNWIKVNVRNNLTAL